MKTGLQESEPPGAELFGRWQNLFLYGSGSYSRNSNKRYETRTKGTKLEQKVRNSKKCMKFEERVPVQNLKENMRDNETKRFFSVSRNNSKHLFSYFFQFRETIETRRNSDMFRTVSYFAKQKQNTKLSTLEPTKKGPAPIFGTSSYINLFLLILHFNNS